MKNNQKKPPKILVVEDEFIVAYDLCETVKDEGYAPMGPFGSVRTAEKALESERPDCALLDVQLVEGEVFELADRLINDGVPVIFHSGHARTSDLCDRYPGVTALEKPCPPSELIVALRLGVEKARTAI
ncbi:MAG TPA: response regulator [Alteraurantiacibacter sp.]|jgi:DNA-binding response OmpR family regulator